MPGALERWRSILASGEPGEFEARLRRFDGEYRHFLISTSALRDATGRIVKWCGVNTDIEERWQTEEVLRARDRFRLIVDDLPEMVTLMTPDGEFADGNRHMQEYFGAPVEELIIRPTTQSFHPEDRPSVDARWKESVETGRPDDFEARLRRADGLHRWFHTRGFPLRDAGGRIVLRHLLQTDVDERKRAEDALRESESRSRLLVDSIPGLVALLTAVGEVQFVNRQILEYTGQTLEQLKEWGTNGTVHPEDLPHVIDVFTQSIHSGSPYEIRAATPAGGRRVSLVSEQRISPSRSAGQVIGWCVLLTDIDERKRAEDALRESERESRLIVDSIPGLVAILTSTGEVEFLNRQVLDYYGKTLEDLKHWETSDATYPEDFRAPSSSSCIRSRQGSPSRSKCERDVSMAPFAGSSLADFRYVTLTGTSSVGITCSSTSTSKTSRRSPRRERAQSEAHHRHDSGAGLVGAFRWHRRLLQPALSGIRGPLGRTGGGLGLDGRRPS